METFKQGDRVRINPPEDCPTDSDIFNANAAAIHLWIRQSCQDDNGKRILPEGSRGVGTVQTVDRTAGLRWITVTVVWDTGHRNIYPSCALEHVDSEQEKKEFEYYGFRHPTRSRFTIEP